MVDLSAFQFSTDKPPKEFKLGPDRAGPPLWVHYWNNLFWISDHMGLICSTADVHLLVLLLSAETTFPQTDHRARELIDPKFAESRAAVRADFERRAAEYMARPKTTAAITPSGASGEDVLKALGL